MAARSSRIQQIFFSFIVICFVCFPAWAKYGGGTGEPNDPYKIATADMQDINTFLDAGWDFVDETANGTEDIWFMPEDDYPSLKREEE